MMDFEIKIDKAKQTPVYLQIKEYLINMIGENQLSEDAMMPNVKVVAEAAGVSLRTADQAMQSLIEDGICYRRPKKGTFVSGNTHRVSRIICGLWGAPTQKALHENRLFAELYRGITLSSQAQNVDANLLFGNPEQALHLYGGSKVFDFRGILVFDIKLYTEALKLAAKFPDKKFIFLNYRLKGINEAPANVYSVVNDDFGGAYRLAEHYIARGCRKFFVLSWKLPVAGDITYRERVRGYFQAARDYGLEFDPEKHLIECFDPNSNNQTTIGYLETRKYLRNADCPEVIFATNDFMAEGIKRCVEDEQLDDKIQVSGYDCLDHELAHRKGFSSVEVKYDQMGKIAIDLITGNGKDLPRFIKIDPVLNIIKQK